MKEEQSMGAVASAVESGSAADEDGAEASSGAMHESPSMALRLARSARRTATDFWWFRWCYTGVCARESCNCLMVLAAGCLLATCAGYINAVALMSLKFTVSHVTGSFTALGLSIAGEDLPGKDGESLAGLLGFFALGAFISGCLTGHETFGIGNHYGTTFLLEGLLLFGGYAVWEATGEGAWTLRLLAAALGVQNAMFSAYSGMIIRTTHLTGTTTDIAMILGHAVRNRLLRLGPSEKEWRLKVYIPLLIAFVSGASMGAAAYVSGLEIAAVLVPAGLLATVGVGIMRFRGNMRNGTRPRIEEIADIEAIADDIGIDLSANGGSWGHRDAAAAVDAAAAAGPAPDLSQLQHAISRRMSRGFELLFESGRRVSGPTAAGLGKPPNLDRRSTIL